MQLGGVEIDAGFFGAIGLFLGFTGIIWLPIVSITMMLLTPKILVKTYFKEPHFSKFELGAMSVFPGTVLRSVVFMASTFQERYRRNRKLDGFLELVPTWYVRASKVFAFCVATMMILLISIGIGLAIWLWLNDLW